MSKLSNGPKKTFVLIIPRFEDILHSYYAGQIIKGVCLAASRLNTDILIHITDRSDHQNWLNTRILDKDQVDGIIFADIDRDVSIVKRAIKEGMPCIVLNNDFKLPINCVFVDNKKATIELVEKLIKKGHRRIATIAGDITTQAGYLRMEGFQEALRKHKIRLPKNYVTNGCFLRTPARKAAEKLLSLKQKPTAIFAASDVMALEVVSVAKAKKINVPEDLSVFGFDNNPLSLESSVKLSTVAQPLVEMGRLGLESLMQISSGKAKLPVKVKLPTKLINRKSVKSIKK